MTARGTRTLATFMAHPTPRDAELLTAIEASMAATALFAASVSARRYQAFLTHYGVQKRQGSHVCLPRLLGQTRCPNNGRTLPTCWSPDGIPGADHLSEWVKDGRTWGIVSQPYDWRWDWDTMAKAVDFCRRLGLRCQVSADASWHYPGKTLLVLYTRADAGVH